jgi:hypothetical protein
MKYIITESKLERVAINWLNDNYGDLKLIHTEKVPLLNFYMQNKNVIFDYRIKTKEIFITMDIWKFFMGYFSMEYKEISKLLIKWVEDNYNINVKKIKPAENGRWKVIRPY